VIDTEKMKALAAHLRAHDERHHLTQNTTDHRAAADAIDTLLAALEAAAADKRRLDFLDKLNAKLNEHYGTTYGWKLILSPNIVRLMSGNHHRGFVGDIDLNDANCGLTSFDSCRKAIDEALSQRQEES
jgi:hypothetical protein